MYKNFIWLIIINLLFLNFLHAQTSELAVTSETRSADTTCKKLSQTLYQGKTAVGKKKQEWLVYEVTRVQLLLDDLGYFGPKPDYGRNYDKGYYDAATTQAVKKYQQENMPWIKSTGTVGPKTVEFLNRYEFCNMDRRFATLNFDKKYTATGLGMYFLYPSSEFLHAPQASERDVTRLGTYLDVCNISDFAEGSLTKKTLCFKRNRQGAFSNASIITSIIPDKLSKGVCENVDAKIKAEEIEESVMMNGNKFFKYKTTYKEVGHEIQSEIYRIFKNGKCYEFKLNFELARLGATQAVEEELLDVLDVAKGKLRASIETLEFTK